MSAQAASPPSPIRRAGLVLGRQNLPPVLLVLAIVGAALLWNVAVGLRWTIGLDLILAAPMACFALAAFYMTVRPDPAIAEAALYAGLWFVYPIFGTRLTYLANHLAWPLQDRLFDGWDLALGFRWMDWANFIAAHPLIQKVQVAAYQSCLWQPVVAIFVFAFWGPKGRNSEFLTSMLVALVVTILFNLFLPTLGPAGFHGLKSQQGDIISALRAGSTAPYDYAGIISFPSFHTAIVILYTAAQRGNRYTFPVFLVWNSVMLTAIPYSGDHYLVDMIAGAFIATSSLLATRYLLRLWNGTPRGA
jgi:hypothetical protein